MAVRTSRPRRFIDVFNRYASPGGEEDSVQRIVSSLERAGHVVSRFFRESDEWLRPGAPARWRQPFLMMRNPGVLAELRALHERERPDAWILHNVIPLVSLGVYRLARELNVPIIQWLHNYRPLSPSGTLRAGETALDAADPLAPLKEAWAGSWRGSRALTAWLALGQWISRRRGDLDGVSAWIAISDAMRAPFERAGIPASRLHTLRHFYRFGPFDPSAGDGGHFLFLGRIVREKGVRELVDLWSAPELKHVQLVIAGEGPLLEESKLRASPNVRFSGFVRGAEKHRLLSTCRGVMVTSVWDEPLGLVVYEAYEHGKPVLSNPAGGLRELIVDGETGRLIPLSDRRAWVDAILALDSDRGSRCAMGREGRRWLERNASEEAWHERLDAILSEALDR